MNDLAAFEKNISVERGRREDEGHNKGRKKRHRRRSEHGHSEKDGQTYGVWHRAGDDNEEDHERGMMNRHRHRHQDKNRDWTPLEEDPDDERHRHKRLHRSTSDMGLKNGVSQGLGRTTEYGKNNDGLATSTSKTTNLDSNQPHVHMKQFLGQGGAKPPRDPGLARDSWMSAPFAWDIDYVYRNSKPKSLLPSNDAASYDVSERELNHDTLQHLNHGKTLDDLDLPGKPDKDCSFGDDGSQWRMTKLNGVYNVAQRTNRTVEEVATESFGSLQEFDEAREEKLELERRRVYGKGYVTQEQPTGDLFRERMEHAKKEKPTTSEEVHNLNDKHDLASASIDQTTLNRLRAQLIKAKLRKLPNTEKLEDVYNEAMRTFSTEAAKYNTTERAVVLDTAHSRMLTGARSEVKDIETKRGKERGLVEANEDMNIEDMVREERRTRGATGGENMRFAERIATDSKFDDNLDYLNENAESLAKRLHKSKASLKTAAVHEFAKMNRILKTCQLCHHEDRQPPQNLPIAPMISLATRVFLTLATEPELTGAEGGAVIVPIDHHTNLLECDDDEWEEIRNFMKSLTRLYHDQGRNVIFYENAATPHRRMHAALVAVPIPYELGDLAPAFFREAMLAADEEWSQHRKIVDTAKCAHDGLGKVAFRKSIAKEMPYFHAWFTLDGGLGHIVEDAERWPRGDLFAREVIGGMLDVDASIVKRQGSWIRTDQRVEDFKKRWKKFDWTRILTDKQ